MNLTPFDKAFPPGGAVGSRRRFWKQVYEEVQAIQKIQGDNVKLSESPDGTTIDVDLRAGVNTGGGGHPSPRIGACCYGSICVVQYESDCTGVFHDGVGCAAGYCASFLPGCRPCGGFPEFVPSFPPRRYLTKTWVGLWSATSSSCAEPGWEAGTNCPYCAATYSYDYLWTRFYDEGAGCALNGDIDTCSGSVAAECTGGYDPALCGLGGADVCVPFVVTGPDGLPTCAWPGAGGCPTRYENCEPPWATVDTITEASQITTVTSYMDTGPNPVCEDPGAPGNDCSGSRTDAIVLADECDTRR